GLELRRLYDNADGSIALQTLIAFLVLGTSTRLVLALAADATKHTLDGLRRATRSRSETRSASVGSDAFADVLANVDGSAAFLFTLAAAAVVLVAAPFLN